LQLGSSCQGNRYGTEKAGGTARPSRTKSHLPGTLSSSQAGKPPCRSSPSVVGSEQCGGSRTNNLLKMPHTNFAPYLSVLHPLLKKGSNCTLPFNAVSNQLQALLSKSSHTFLSNAEPFFQRRILLLPRRALICTAAPCLAPPQPDLHCRTLLNSPLALRSTAAP
jgi:hypothetical protein